ncbi:MAG: hypothetical protein WC346_04485 [Methanogenium sp.]|jgi:hypothetical protein
MKLWINFEDEDIKKRINGWKEGDDFEGQLVFEEESIPEDCGFDYKDDKIRFYFNNGYIEINKKELGKIIYG